MLAVQQPQVVATVSRSRVAVGDTVTLTIQVETQGNAPVRVMDPPLERLSLEGVRETSEVRVTDEGVARRTLDPAPGICYL